MGLKEAVAMNEEFLNAIANGEIKSPEFGRSGWTRSLQLSSGSCHLIWSDTKTKYEPTAYDILADDWNVYPKEN